MICKHCETENPEDSVYCKNCGKRLDGMRVCPSCKSLNPEDALFCSACGTNLDEAEGAKKASKEETPAGTGWKKWVELAGGILAMVAVFCVLLCTFLTGFAAKSSMISQSQNLWYYFGDVWKDLNETDFGDFALIKASVYTEAVLGLLISIAMIATTVILSILAAVRFGKKAAGKSEKDYFGFALGAVLSFICGTALLVALNATELSIYEVKMYTAPNDAGLAGIILGIIFICGCIGCRIAIKGKSLLSKQSVMSLAFSLGAIVFLSIALAFTVSPACILGEEFEIELMGSSIYVTSGSKFSFVAWAQAIAPYELYSDEMTAPVVLLIFSAIMQIVVAATAFTAIGKMMKNFVSENYKSGLKEAIALTVVSALLLAFSVAGLVLCKENLEMDSNFNYAYVIVQFVFAALTVVVAAVEKALCKNKKITQ